MWRFQPNANCSAVQPSCKLGALPIVFSHCCRHAGRTAQSGAVQPFLAAYCIVQERYEPLLYFARLLLTLRNLDGLCHRIFYLAHVYGKVVRYSFQGLQNRRVLRDLRRTGSHGSTSTPGKNWSAWRKPGHCYPQLPRPSDILGSNNARALMSTAEARAESPFTAACLAVWCMQLFGGVTQAASTK